jgi:hypothetical protein
MDINRKKALVKMKTHLKLTEKTIGKSILVKCSGDIHTIYGEKSKIQIQPKHVFISRRSMQQ